MMLVCIIADLTSRVNASFFQILVWKVHIPRDHVIQDIQDATCINDLLSHNLLGGSIELFPDTPSDWPCLQETPTLMSSNKTRLVHRSWLLHL